MPVTEIPYSAQIQCDICGVREDGSLERFFNAGWAVIPRTRTGHQRIAVCRTCNYIRRFQLAVNPDLYSHRDEVIKRWEEVEKEGI